MTQTAQRKITRENLEAKFRETQDSLQGKFEDKKQTVISIGIVVGIIVLLLFFVLGKRAGKKKTTFVDIRRV